MRTHITNENTFRGAVVGSAFWAGRGWLHAGKGHHAIAHAEWFWLHKARGGPACTLSFGGGDSDRDVMLHVRCPFLFNLYLVAEDILSRNSRFKDHNSARDLGFYWYEGSLKLQLWSRGGMGDWSSRDPWWLHPVTIDFDRLIFGRREHVEVDDTGWKDTVVPMPEGPYPAQIRLYTSEWRGRFGTMRIRRAEIKCERGIPTPGKGENSWDCGEDATYGLTCMADNEWDAVGKMVATVYRQRCRYGGGTKWRSNEVPVP